MIHAPLNEQGVVYLFALVARELGFTVEAIGTSFPDCEAKRRFIELLREQFNSGVRFNKRIMKWDTFVEQKTAELARYLTGKSSSLDFLGPQPELEKTDRPVWEMYSKTFRVGRSKTWNRRELGQSLSERVNIREVVR